MATLPDFADPCAVYTALQAAHHKLITGQMTETVRYTSGSGQTEEVTFSRVNIAALQEEMSRAKALCEASKDGKPKRYAIATGGKRRPFYR